jgi:hypothetical protein
MPEELLETQLSLNRIEEMFDEPAADPFDPQSRYISGIDELVGKLRLRGIELTKPSRLVIRLPGAAVTSDTQPTLKAAMDRYCSAKIAENQQVIHELRAMSRRQTIAAFVSVAILFVLTVLLLSAIPELQVVSGAIYGLVMVTVWIIVWDPIYNYVYSWRPNRLDIKVHENLRAADLVVEAM